jgi:hypothetical protein
MPSPLPGIAEDEFRRAISTLTLREILGRLKGILPCSNQHRSNKELLVEHILSSAPIEQIEFLQQLAEEKKNTKAATSLALKRKRTENRQAARQARRVDNIVTEEEQSALAQFEEDHNIDQFLELPTKEEVQECYRQFHDATSNNALELSICGICAQEISMCGDKPTLFNLKDIPNSQRLIPSSPHSRHDLYGRLLLEPGGVIGEGDKTQVRICRTCLRDLQNSSNKPPRFALANNLWIGRIPWQLEVLTFAEQLLIAHVYPRVYTFKLFPKKIGGHRDHANLQRGMRGNVSSYELNMDSIRSMLEGNLMPRPPEILASIITITFIGVGDLPKKSLWNTFRVRRHAVSEALCWLRENNPKYYGNVEMSSERLRLLPEEDIPQAIIDVVHQSTEVGVVDQESEGYVPTEETAQGKHDLKNTWRFNADLATIDK